MHHRRKYQFNAGIAGVGATAVLTALFYVLTKWHPYICWLIAGNIVVFIMFGIDKGAAKARTVRIPESVLHLLTLLGGAIGQLLGRAVFRHKSNLKAHPLFLIIPLISLLFHGALLYFLFLR